MLSAFLRSCLSVTPPLYPMLLAALEIGPGWPGAPIMADKARASVAADSMAWKMSERTRCFVLPRAERSSGWVSRVKDALLLQSARDRPLPDPRFGDADTVVAFVVAVGGRSSDDRDVDAPDLGGSFPVSSNR